MSMGVTKGGRDGRREGEVVCVCVVCACVCVFVCEHQSVVCMKQEIRGRATEANLSGR